MEIISYVLDGALEHKDSLGTGSVIRPGDVQRMSAGSGIRHSEFNASETAPVHFLQIWIIPEKRGIAPSYEQKSFPDAEKRGKLRLVGSRDGRDGSVTIHQDVSLYSAALDEGDGVGHTISEGRVGWVQVARGSVRVNGQLLRAGDGLATEAAGELTIKGMSNNSDVLLFDMVA
jgi:redox-sensitive bicupin YhaK (pirin superfamily)